MISIDLFRNSRIIPCMTLHRAIINSHDYTSDEADELIGEMRERVLDGEDPEEVLEDEGLEPDYVLDIL